jgi:predicted enzyme related to lactoylglutathione lyase
MEVDSYDDGVPSWVDLGTSDPAGAAEFYRGLFGWEVEAGPPESGGYMIALLRGRPVAGLGPQMNPGTPYWNHYVKESDTAATVQKVTANGGKVLVEPMDVMGQGIMAVCADAAGAVFSIWQPLAFPGAGIVNEPGSFAWTELITDDIEGARQFYGAVLGWDAEGQGEGQGAYYEWKLNGRSIGGMMPKPPMIPAEVPPFWGVYFMVADTDQTVARVTELGGSVIVPPTDIEPGRFAVVADPTGAAFNVMAMRQA